VDEWKRERIERDRREYLRKMTDASFNRMRQRTAKEQLAEAMRQARGPDQIPEPDADDSSWRGSD
jgi:hypothetical protein